jgi:dienelactone hydrolase
MKNKLISLLLLAGVLTYVPTQAEVDARDLIIIRTWGAKNTVIFAHGCDGAKGHSYRRRAEKLAKANDVNVVIYDAFVPRGYKDVCGRGHIVNVEMRLQDTKEIARWVSRQTWHRGKISFIGYSHGGSVGLAVATDKEATELISSVVSYYPTCNQKWIQAPINDPVIPIMVHFGDSDDWTPSTECMLYKDHPNYKMLTYKNTTHAFDIGLDTVSLGKYRITYNEEASRLAEKNTNEFFKETLK